MIEAFEQQLAAWLQQLISELAAGCALFPANIRTVSGSSDPLDAALDSLESAVAVRLSELSVEPDEREIGPSSPRLPDELRFRAAGSLHLLGPADEAPLSAEEALSFDVPEGSLFRTDIALLTALSRLRERVVPAPSGGVGRRAAAPFDGVVVAAGPREVSLRWHQFLIGVVGRQRLGSRRAWVVPFTVHMRFQLSPSALEGGRILTIPFALGGAGATMRGDIYAPAEALPLDWFAGIAPVVREELAARGIQTLGDLHRAAEGDLPTWARSLRTLPEQGEAGLKSLEDLVDLAELRRVFAANATRIPVDPDFMALPARALLEPRAHELQVVLRNRQRADTRIRLTMLGLPLVKALLPERLEALRVGHILRTPYTEG